MTLLSLKVKPPGIVLRPGPTWRVDMEPGRPGHGTGPDRSKNSPGSWPGETRSTRDPADLGKPGWNPVFYIYIYIYIYKGYTMSFWLKDQNNEMNDALMHWCRIAAIARVTIADADTTFSQFSNHNLANSLIFSLLMESLKAPLSLEFFVSLLLIQLSL
jgi:hypothetical protein